MYSWYSCVDRDTKRECHKSRCGGAELREDVDILAKNIFQCQNSNGEKELKRDDNALIN